MSEMRDEILRTLDRIVEDTVSIAMHAQAVRRSTERIRQYDICASGDELAVQIDDTLRMPIVPDFRRRSRSQACEKVIRAGGSIRQQTSLLSQ